MSNICIYPGFDDKIFQAVKQKMKALPRESELCTQVIDEVAIKEWVDYGKRTDGIGGVEN